MPISQNLEKLKALVAEFEELEQSSEPYACDAALDTLRRIGYRVSLLRYQEEAKQLRQDNGQT